MSAFKFVYYFFHHSLGQMFWFSRPMTKGISRTVTTESEQRYPGAHWRPWNWEFVDFLEIANSEYARTSRTANQINTRRHFGIGPWLEWKRDEMDHGRVTTQAFTAQPLTRTRHQPTMSKLQVDKHMDGMTQRHMWLHTDAHMSSNSSMQSESNMQSEARMASEMHMALKANIAWYRGAYGIEALMASEAPMARVLGPADNIEAQSRYGCI